MANYNKVILAGNLTRDPQLTYTPSQTAVCDFGMAVNRRWRGQDGQPREETCFVDCRCFGKQAETFNQYMAKGRQVLVEGRLSFSQWETQEGQKRSKLRVTVETFQFLGSGQGQGGQQGGYSRPQQQGGYQQPPQQAQPQQYSQPAPAAPANQEPSAPPSDFDMPGGESEDIPF